MIQTASFIGSGRVATHLAQALSPYVEIKHILSRDLLHAKALADQVNATPIDQIEHLEEVDIIFIAVSDAQIATVAQNLAEQNYQGLVVHTSGSTHIDVLTQYALKAGVFYPLQTFSFEHQVDWKNTPLFIEAIAEQHQADVVELAKKISDRCYVYDSVQRLSLHLAAVFACNFTNHCYDIAQQMLSEKKVDFDLLMPLIQSTTQKLNQTSAEQNQTGPARRKDENILAMHQEMLKDQHNWQQIYQLMSQSIMQRFDKE